MLLLGIRAENVEVTTDRSGNQLRGTVMVVEPLGSHNLVTLRVGGELLKATMPADQRPAPDQEVGVTIDPAHIRWLDEEAGLAIDRAEEAGPGAGLGAPRPEETEDTPASAIS
jgi:multiple sugar transport system ATP-binding protein